MWGALRGTSIGLPSVSCIMSASEVRQRKMHCRCVVHEQRIAYDVMILSFAKPAIMSKRHLNKHQRSDLYSGEAMPDRESSRICSATASF